jgi:hypothetical protein
MGPNRIKSHAGVHLAQERAVHSCRVLLHPASSRGGERVRRDARAGQATAVATVDVLHKDVEDNSYVEKIERFLARIGNLQAVLEA